MLNKDIISVFRLTASLLDLHEANPFKIKGYNGIVFKLDSITETLADLSIAELQNIEGINKSWAEKIYELCTIGTFEEFDTLQNDTPKGVIEMLSVKGLGAKKVRTIWKDLQIEGKYALLKACEEGKIAGLKGFGEKTEEKIKDQLIYEQNQIGKYLYAEIEEYTLKLFGMLKAIFPSIEITGDFALLRESIDKLQFLIASEAKKSIHDQLNEIPFIVQNKLKSSPFCWRGGSADFDLHIEIFITNTDQFSATQLKLTSAPEHFFESVGENAPTLFSVTQTRKFNSVAEIYSAAQLPFFLPELREKNTKIEIAKNSNELVTVQDLKGSLHNHSTYSDGKNTLEEMTNACIDLNYQYFGICDHSKSAFYARGLDEDRIAVQHAEIERINTSQDKIHVFKGIESDILSDGSLDYENDILAEFDFIVASVHSNLTMKMEKANERLIKAIENPFTTILGHPTGRLLLRREGYPIDHKKIIDACADNQVIIEINANPWRLDLDWRHIAYALEKGVMLSINPDAHNTNGLLDVKYGVNVARKGGLTAEMTLNALNIAQVKEIFARKK